MTSPVARGGTASVVAQTAAFAQCTVTVYYGFGSATASGVADANGLVAWSWTVTTNITPGTYLVAISATSGGLNGSATVSYVVT